MLGFIIFSATLVSCLAAGPILKDCQAKGDSAVVLTNAVVTPYPPSFPGKIKVSFDLEVKKQLDNFDIRVTLVKDVDGFPLTIPCIDGVGSCTTEDACSVLEEQFPNGCPPELPQCKCPFKPAKRQVRDLEVDLPAFPAEIKELAVGKYDIKLELLEGFTGEVLSCLSVKLQLAATL